VAVKRGYQSTRRQEQARQTRRAILDAAGKLFVDPGYAATPLTAVAAEAGVAIQTVYAAFGSKRHLLSELVDTTIAGDDEPVALPDRPFVAEIRALADPRDKLARYARHLTEIHARQADVMIALAGAATADPDAGAIWRKNAEDRRRGMTMLAADLAATGHLRPGHTPDSAADVLWLAMDVRNYDWLVRRRGWSIEQYQRWYVDTVSAALLAAPQ
jgi:AcrR family transcriptional regulator